MYATTALTILSTVFVATGAAFGQSAACPADLNDDSLINGGDLALVLAYWGSQNGDIDLDGNGVVGGGDLALVLGDWGKQCNPFWDDVDVQFVGEMMVVTTTGRPSHQIGPFDGSYYDPDTGQYCVNPNTTTVQNDVWMIPVQPTPTDTPAVDVLATGGPIAVSITGAAIYNAYDGGGAEAPGNICMDICRGHPSPDGRYHYHQYSECFNEATESDGHSGIIGYSFDGYAIYGLTDIGGVTPSDLDECGGHTDSIRGYHYHLQNQFPFSLGCYHGEPEPSNFAGGGGPGGCNACAANMVPPQICNCVRNTPGYGYCCNNWDAACQAYADSVCN